METVYDESLPVLERIKFPMVWERLVCGVRVEDLQPQRYKEAVDIVEVSCCQTFNTYFYEVNKTH